MVRDLEKRQSRNVRSPRKLLRVKRYFGHRMNTQNRHANPGSSTGMFMRAPNITLHRPMVLASLTAADRLSVAPSDSWAGRTCPSSNQAFQSDARERAALVPASVRGRR